MTEESDDSDSSDPDNSKTCPIIIKLAGIALCAMQFSFFVYMVVKFLEMDFPLAFKSMFLAYSSALLYYLLENYLRINTSAAQS